MTNAVIVRPMRSNDLSSVAAISAELGYPASAAQLAENFDQLQCIQRNGFFVAVDTANNDVIGWVHAYGVVSFVSHPYAEIGGLVVTAVRRRLGAGRQLMQAAEAWTRAQGYDHIRLASGAHREDAHRFYESIGYQKQWSGVKFRKYV